MRTLVILATIAMSSIVAAPAAQAGDVCQTQACHHRVAVKQRAAVRASCRSVSCKRRVAIKQATAKKRAFIAPYDAWLNATARCESGGNWAINTGNSFYGGLQFTLGSWQAVGGRGMPHLAPILEQKYRGVKLLLSQGRGAWPVCG